MASPYFRVLNIKIIFSPRAKVYLRLEVYIKVQFCMITCILFFNVKIAHAVMMKAFLVGQNELTELSVLGSFIIMKSAYSDVIC